MQIRFAPLILTLMLDIYFAKATEPESIERIYIDLPMQPLQQALIELSLQANSTIIAKLEDVHGYDSTPIIGPFELKKALNLVISKAPIEVTYMEDTDSYVLHRRPDTIEEKSSINSPIFHQQVIEEVLVTGTTLPSRYSTLTNSQTKNGVSLFDSARFHHAFSRSLIDDIKPTSLIDLLEYSGSIVRGVSYPGSTANYYVRGYQRKNIYVDGFRLSDRTSIQLMPENIQKVELLKGPSMLFYGQSGAGGVVNINQIKPDKTSFFKGSTALNQYGNSKVVLDINRSHDKNYQFTYRLQGIHEANENNTLFQSQGRSNIHFSFKKNIKENLYSHLNYQWQRYQHAHARDSNIISEKGMLLDHKIDKLFVNKERFRSNIHILNSSLHYLPKKNWRITINYQWQEEERLGIRPDPHLIEETDVLINRSPKPDNFSSIRLADSMISWFSRNSCGSKLCSQLESAKFLNDQEEFESDISLGLSAAGNFHWIKSEHKVILGLDFYHQDLYQYFSIVEYISPEFRDIKIIDSFDQLSFSTYWLPIFAETTHSAMELKEYRTLRYDFGAYSQIHSYWSSTFSTSLGWRYSYFDGEQRNLTQQRNGLISNTSYISPQFGLTYQFIDSLSIFINYSESAAIRYLLDDSNNFAQKPEIAQQWEAGGKWLGLGGNASAALAIFDIQKSNAHRVELTDNQRVLIGPYNIDTYGIEAEANLQLKKNWNFVSHFSWLDSQTKTRNTRYQTPYSADIQWSLFASYSFKENWKTTLGYRYISPRSLNYNQSIKIPAVAIVDFSLCKTLNFSNKNLEISLNIKNLSNSEHYKAALLNSYADVSLGREYSASISFKP